MNTYLVCLKIGLMDIKYIENPEGDWIDDYDELESFQLEDVFGSNNILDQCVNLVSLTFEGDLDDPSLFQSITAVGVQGPKFIVEESILSLSDTIFYFRIDSLEDLDINNLEDLIHLIEPVVEKDGYTIAFGDFADWEIYLDDEEFESRQIKIEWSPE
jgi:hypothetical protein